MSGIIFNQKCLSCARYMQLCCHICGVGQNGEREYYKPKPRTNADRIRNMSDEELAEWFQTVCTASSECSCSDCKFYALECTFEEWLEQEVE